MKLSQSWMAVAVCSLMSVPGFVSAVPMPMDESALSGTSGQAAGVTFEMLIRAKIDTAQFQLGRSLYLDQIYVNKLGKPVGEPGALGRSGTSANATGLSQSVAADINNAESIVDALAADLNVDNQIRPVWSKDYGLQKDGVLMELSNSGEFGVSINAIKLGAPMKIDANDDGRISLAEKLAYRQHVDSLPSMGGLRLQGINLTGTKVVNFSPANMKEMDYGFVCGGECIDVTVPGASSLAISNNAVGMYNELLLSIGDATKQTGGITWIDGIPDVVEDFMVLDETSGAMVKGQLEDKSLTLQGVKIHSKGDAKKGARMLMVLDVVEENNIKKLRLQTRSSPFDIVIGRIVIGRSKNSLGALSVVGLQIGDSTVKIYPH